MTNKVFEDFDLFNVEKESLVSEQSITDFGQDAMTRYATEVNLERSIPDYYDGLKPVQRRILQSAYPTKGKAVKTARIIGVALALYHPHGDCLKSDTEFYCLDGKVRTIKELYEAKQSVWVLSYNAQQNAVVPALAHSFRIGQFANKTYKIHLSSGDTIESTSNHPFYVQDHGWIKTEDLKPNMFLLSASIDYDTKSILAETVVKGFGVYITNIEVIKHDMPIPMYDFTVDGFENAFIIMKSNSNGRRLLIAAHNSSVSAAIETMVNSNVPLITGIGNWGSLLDSAAAYRYTNCLLSHLGELIFDKDYINTSYTIPNYDGKDTEHLTLPVPLPMVLLNGSDGIGVGVTSKIPSLSLDSVVEALKLLLTGQKVSIADLAKILKPHQKYGGHFLDNEENHQQWEQLIRTGRASITYYAKLKVDEKKKEIEIDEWPAGLNPERFIQKVKLLPETNRAYNSKGATTFKIECKKSIAIERFAAYVEKIKKMVTVSQTYRINVTQRVPKVINEENSYETKFLSLGVAQILVLWTRTRIEIELKSLRYKIDKKQKEIAYSELLILAAKNLDIVFRALQTVNSQQYLSKQLKISEEQAQQILELKVRQLSKLDQRTLREKLKLQQEELKHFEMDLKNPRPAVLKSIQHAYETALKDRSEYDEQQAMKYKLK